MPDASVLEVEAPCELSVEEQQSLAASAEEAPQPVEEAPEMTREEAVALVFSHQLKGLDQRDFNERLQVGIRKGLLVADPSYIYTLAELKALVPLKRDRLNYEWANEDKGTKGVLAKNAHGLLSVPKQRGRRKPHMTQHQQAIKSASLSIFGRLFAEKAERLKAVCKTEEIDYLGVPDSAIPELGARAAKQALVVVKENRRQRRVKARRRQQFSRKVNAGIFGNSRNVSAMNNPGERNYAEHGGAYGR